jgi:hypothetical protein
MTSLIAWSGQAPAGTKKYNNPQYHESTYSKRTCLTASQCRTPTQTTGIVNCYIAKSQHPTDSSPQNLYLI